MRKIGGSSRTDVGLNPLPVTFVIPDPFAPGTNREQSRERPGVFERAGEPGGNAPQFEHRHNSARKSAHGLLLLRGELTRFAINGAE